MYIVIFKIIFKKFVSVTASLDTHIAKQKITNKFFFFFQFEFSSCKTIEK